MRVFLFMALGVLLFIVPVVPEQVSLRSSLLQYHPPYATLLEASENPGLLPPPDLIAGAAVIYDPERDQILFQKQHTTPFGIASITKIMTALVALERVGESELIQISADAVKTEGVEGNLVVGEHISLHDLITLMMIASSNDAATAVAEHVGSIYGASTFEESQQIFVRMMNETAQRLGLQETTFNNPTGLDADEKAGLISNVSTAMDVARLIAYALKYPFVTSANTVSTVISQEGIEHPVLATHTLLTNETGMLGGKTGFTDFAGGALVTIAEVPLGKLSILVVLGSTREGRFYDTEQLLTWLRTQ